VRAADAGRRRSVPLLRDGAFGSGVMSGDPTPTAVTLWTRVDDVAEPRGRVRLEVARDEGFRQVVARRDVPVTALRDHTAKVRIGGLAADERYFYRFHTRTTQSDVGRTQTAPAPDSTRPLTIAYFACQDFSSGFYGVYRRLLAADPDVVICGGDYIYDRIYSESGYGGARPDTVGSGPDSVARTLAQYRAKYRLYRTDPDLRELHRLVPLVPQWDDHEVTDNYVGTLGDGREEPADDGEAADRFDRQRILAGWRAWHEHMPAQRLDRGYRTFRSLRFGRTAELIMLDSRSYRDDQPCGGGAITRCDDQAPRKYLGTEQLAWAKERLASSPARWKVVGNQLMIMPFDIAAGIKVEVDGWNGYPAERRDLLTSLERQNVQDVVFLTGDIHTFMAGEVRTDGETGRPVASEIVGGSTTSPGTAQTIGNTIGLPADLAKPLLDNAPLLNPWYTFFESRAHGCALLTLTDTELTTRLLASRDVRTRDGSADVRTLATLTITSGVPRPERA
jgi:alkaline phosphatase D